MLAQLLEDKKKSKVKLLLRGLKASGKKGRVHLLCI